MKTKIIQIINDPRIKNSMWMLIEKGISLFGLIFVVSAVAKYVGPELYGIIALATSVFIIVKSVSQLGSDQIYFKQISKGRTRNDLFLQNTIKLISFIYCIITTIILFIFFLNNISLNFLFFLATSISFYFASIDIRSIHLDAILNSKFNVYANIIGLVVSLIMRYVIVKFKLSEYYLCIPIIAITLIPYLIRLYIFKKNKIINNTLNNKNFFYKHSKYLLKVGVPLVISTLSVSIYLQSANFILASFQDISSVGVYSIAVMLAGTWYFIPVTLIMSFLPKIYDEKNTEIYIKNAGILFRYIIIGSSLIIFIFWNIIDFVIDYLYGNKYMGAIVPFKILLFGYLFSVVGFYFYRLIVKFGGYNFLAKKMIITCILNIILTLFLVKKYGIIGAAISTLLTEFVSNIIFNLIYRKAKFLSILKYAIFNKV